MAAGPPPGITFILRQAASNALTSAPAPQTLLLPLGPNANVDRPEAYERYLLDCSDYLRRQMIIYEHWPQRKYDVLGYRNEKVFPDMNA